MVTDMSPFDSPRDPLPGCEDCPEFDECPGVHDCLLEPDPDAYDEEEP